MPEANSLQEERLKIMREMETMDGGGEGYKERLNNLSLIQKLEQEDVKLDLSKKEIALKERELDIQEKEPSILERGLEIAKVVLPSIVTGIFSFALVRHMTKHEQDDGLYYGSKAMGFIKKP